MPTGSAIGQYSGNYPDAPTVQAFLKDPTLIRDSFNDLIEKRPFIGESLFTRGYSAEGGAIKYREAAKKYVEEFEADSNEDFSIAEGTEFHNVSQTEPGEVIERVRKYAIEGWVTFEDRDRNNIGAFARLQRRMLNTMERYFDQAAFAKLRNATGPQDLTRANRWDVTSTTTIIDDILNATEMLTDFSLTGGQIYGSPELLIGRSTYTALRRNIGLQDMWETYDMQGQDPRLGGKISTLAGIPVTVSDWMYNDKAFLLERGTIGGIADEVPLTVKPLETDEGTERIVIRIKRLTVMFLTDPKALVRINNINSV